VGHERLTKAEVLVEFAKRREVALRIARAILRRLPNNVSRDDVEQAALVGLWQALASDYDRTQSGYEALIRIRIRGSVIDELRAQDWLPRRARKEAGDNQAPISVVHLEDRSGDAPPWEDRLGDGRANQEERLAVQRDFAEALRAPLSPRDRRTVELLIFRGVRMLDVAAELGCSEARISQRYARALQIMRAHLTGEFAPVISKHHGLSEADKLRIRQRKAKEGRKK
jgi:RNA polymerase sigma factor for flagellar operon FliA